MNEERNMKFDALVTGKQSNFLKESEEIIKNEEWLVASAGVIFMLLDFMKQQTPKMTKAKLAEELGVSPQYVGKVLHGRENMTLQTRTKIAVVMGMSFWELIAELSSQLAMDEVNVEDEHQLCLEELVPKRNLLAFEVKGKRNSMATSFTQKIAYSEETTYAIQV